MIKEQAGLMSFVAPSIKSLTFEFLTGTGHTLTIASKTGPKTIKADAKEQIVFTLGKSVGRRKSSGHPFRNAVESDA